MGEPRRDLPGLALVLFRFERVDEFDGGEEAFRTGEVSRSRPQGGNESARAEEDRHAKGGC